MVPGDVMGVGRLKVLGRLFDLGRKGPLGIDGQGFLASKEARFCFLTVVR